MSGRNNRIIRNREKNDKRIDWNSNNIKIIVSIATIILIIIITAIIMCAKVRNQKNISEISEIDENNLYEYFLLIAGENVGVIDKTGKELIETKYSRNLHT